MKIYRVTLINHDGNDIIIGYATTEEKARKMIYIMKTTDGFEDYEYEYCWVYTDILMINDKKIEI